MFDQAYYDAKDHLSATLLSESFDGGEPIGPEGVDVGGGGNGGGSDAVPNIHAVGIGRKMVGGAATGDLVIRVYVIKQSANDPIPDQVNGIPTEVIESPIAMFASCTDERKNQIRPVIGGISVSHPATGEGTLGCFCRSTLPGEGGETLALSCNHVFGTNSASVGDPLFQPAQSALPQTSGPFATFLRNEKVRSGTDNVIDAAVGLVTAPFSDEICSIGTVSSTAVGAEGMQVSKHGCATGLTNGKITDESYDHVIPDQRTGVTYKFVNQLRIEPLDPDMPFAAVGDSGSLVVSAMNHAAVGLLFAKDSDGSGSYAIANRFELVEKVLNVELLKQGNPIVVATPESLVEKKRQISDEFDGVGPIHGVGISRSRNAIRLYLDPGSALDDALLSRIQEKAAPFPVVIIEASRPMFAGE